MSLSRQEFALADGATLTYSSAGDGPPLVLLHGALADHRMWAAHQHLLAQRGWQAIAPTQRHFGSAPAGQAPFGVETHAHDLAAWLAALHPAGAHLAAWSYGAHVALWLALQQPKLVRSLFLYEPGFPTWVTDPVELAAFGADAQAMFGPVFGAVQSGDLPGAVRALMNGSGQRAGYFDAQPVARRRLQLENAHSLPLLLQQAPPPQIGAGDLARLQMPLAIGRGALSRPVFTVVARAAQAHAPGAHFVVADAGHLWPDEDPAGFCDRLAAHLVRAP